MAEAKTRGLSLVVPDSVEEEAGTGVAAIIGGRRVHVGNLAIGSSDGERAEAASVLSRAALDGAVVACAGRR